MTSWTDLTQSEFTAGSVTKAANHLLVVTNQVHLYSTHGARAFCGTAQSIPNNALTPVILTSETANHDTDAFHSTSVNPSRFTIPTGLDGRYEVKANVHFAANSTGVRRLVIIVNNTTIFAEDRENNPDASADTWLSVTADIPLLNAGNYIEAQVLQNSGSPLNLNTSGSHSPHVSVRWVGNE